MRTKISLMAFFVMPALGFFLFPCFLFAKDVITIKAATMHPVKHRLTDDCFLQYAKEVEKRTNGTVKFNWYLGGSLVQWKQAQQAVKTGLVDMVLVLPVYHHISEYPVSAAISLPFIADSSAHASLIFYKMYQSIPEMKYEYAHVKPLAFSTSAIADLHTIGSPPKTLEDLKGMRLLCVSAVSANLLKALGASPIVINIQDLYMSLQRGMGDGLIFADAPMRSLKLIDIISNHTLGRFYVAPHIFAMNLKKWQSLPSDIQRIFEDLTLSAGCLAGATLTNESEWVIEELRKRGDRFYSLPPQEKARWVKAAQPLYDDWITNLNSRGLNGQAIYQKVMELQEDARNNPYKPDDWWGRAGKMK